jgi:hypothetical protein
VPAAPANIRINADLGKHRCAPLAWTGLCGPLGVKGSVVITELSKKQRVRFNLIDKAMFISDAP